MIPKFHTPILLIFLLIVSSALSATDSAPVNAENWDFTRQGALVLNGNWDFAWNQFVEPGNWEANKKNNKQAFSAIKLPGYWNTHGFPIEGYASYRLMVRLPPSHTVYSLSLGDVLTAWTLYIDGVRVGGSGTPGMDAQSTIPSDGKSMVYFHPSGVETEILIHVANFDYRKSGIHDAPVIDTDVRAQARQLQDLVTEVMVMGGLLIMVLYHLGLFMLRQQEKSSLWFGLFCLVVLLRFVVTGSYLIQIIIPGFLWEISKRVEFLIFNAGNIPFMLFIQTLFPAETGKKRTKFFILVSGILGVIFAILPIRISNQFIVYLEIYVLILFVVFLAAVVKALLNKRRGSLLFLVGISILLFASVNDILYANQLISTGYVVPIAFFFVILLQAFLLSRNYNDSFVKIEALTHNLSHTNQSLSRFIPYEFLRILQKKSITEVKLGDQVQAQMAVMFSDIRGFTGLSEGLSPLETFAFLNEYFGRVGSIIRSKNGFIDKYLGDGILALFPDKPDDALFAAVALQRSVAQFNEQRAKTGLSPLQVGTGIHFGTISLGTIGEAGRMDTTVIADAVNIASRMESLTKAYGSGTIISVSYLDLIDNPDDYHWRYLGMIRVQGRREPLEAAHIYDGLAEPLWKLFHETKTDFEEALARYRSGDLAEARKGFNEIVKKNPLDAAAKTYHSRIVFLMESGLPDDWDGIEAGPVK